MGTAACLSSWSGAWHLPARAVLPITPIPLLTVVLQLEVVPGVATAGHP